MPVVDVVAYALLFTWFTFGSSHLHGYRTARFQTSTRRSPLRWLIVTVIVVARLLPARLVTADGHVYVVVTDYDYDHATYRYGYTRGYRHVTLDDYGWCRTLLRLPDYLRPGWMARPRSRIAGWLPHGYYRLRLIAER